MVVGLPPRATSSDISTTPALVIVASPLRAAAVKPVPSPISICVSATALADMSPSELASRTITVLAATCCIFANVTPVVVLELSANLTVVIPPSFTIIFCGLELSSAVLVSSTAPDANVALSTRASRLAAVT